MCEYCGDKPEDEKSSQCVMKVIDATPSLGWEAASPVPYPLERDMRQSTFNGTRKMVSFTWAERSQEKSWWKFVAVLTCKSFARPGQRGARLIEPSSSWFPPKFLSG